LFLTDPSGSRRASATASPSAATSRRTTRTSASSPACCPARERELDFNSPVFVAELDLAKLRKLLTGIEHVEDLPQFPGSSRDAAMELPATLPNAEIEGVLLKCNEPLLVSFECFDVFTDPTGVKLPADRKSVAYRTLPRCYRAARPHG
jgi:phenylalanyl-tRNA synthetase beta subunit